MTVDPTFSAAAALTLACVFTLGAVHKLEARLHFEGALTAYELVPLNAVSTLARVLPAGELASALALVAGVTRPAGGLVALLLLATYTAAIAYNLKRGKRDIDCGCGGGNAETPLSEWLLLRNGALALLALIALLPRAPRELGWLDLAAIAAAAAVLVLLYLTVEQLLANQPGLRRIRS